jgi:pyruvate dehydrogenase E1 component alpha subunit
MQISKEKLAWMYETMYRIRRFEERLLEETVKGNAMGVAHTSDGQEAGPTGICAHLTEKDWIGSTHRGHGHCIAKGVETNRMMAEIFGRLTGMCKGKGGSMHIADFSKGMLGANGIVGASVPLAVGAALSARYFGSDAVGVAFFGDGATSQGVVHESMNLAAIWRLGVIFACENNHYAESTPVEYAVAGSDIADRAAGYGIPGVVVDGMDVFAVYEAAGEAVRRARAGEGPTLLELKTYRYHGHYHADEPLKYRLKEEEDLWKKRDPIPAFEKRVLEQKLMTAGALESIRAEIESEIEAAVTFALESPLPPIDELYTDVYVNYSNPVQGLR